MAQQSHFLLKGRIIINSRLILSKLDDPDPEKRYFLSRFGRYKYVLLSLGLKRLGLVLLVLLLPISVSAGLVQTISNIFFKDSEAEVLFDGKNVQSMALLVAVSAPSDGSHTPIIESGALVPEVSPSGTISEAASKPTSDQISVYVVREGDTLSQIAEMFNVTVNTIKWGNDLSSNTVRPGQTLVILPISGIRHTVAKGDTLESLAKKYNADTNEIMDYNNISKDGALAVGAEIIIPDGEAPFSSSGGSSVRSAIPNKEYIGYYLRPIAGGTKTQGIHGNNAVDLAAPAGTPIYAAAEGEVIIARTGGWNGGYGNYIVVKHPNGTQTLYAHNSVNYVAVGDSVERGETIGAVGHTGRVSGPTGNHLHFEIRGAKNPF